MKRKIFLTTMLVIMLLLSSCNSSLFSKCRKEKSLDYQYVGLYINFVDEKTKTLDDSNVKIYIDKLNNDILVCRNDLMFYGNFQLSVSSSADIDQVDIYPIILKDGAYSVKTDESYNIKLTNKEFKSLTFRQSYVYNKQSYNLEIILKILKKEV